ncbi:MAG: hypothetical protein RLZZ08_1704 [Pseudomonadota bacterium]
MKPREHFIALDSLRGIAAIAVVLFHIGDFGWIAGIPVFRACWLLVDFFFILSGFVIATSYGERLAQGYPKGRFMALRAWRVLPLHYVVLAVMVLLQLVLVGPVLHERHNTEEFWRSLFLLDAFRPHTGNWYTPVSWTLAVEMVLYVLAAALFGRGRIGVAVAVLLAAAAGWCLWTGTNLPGFGSLMQRGVLGFSLGVGARALHVRFAGKASAMAVTVAEVVALAAIVWVLASVRTSSAAVLAVDAVFLPAVLIFARDGGLVSRALHANWVVVLGRLSFAIYMTHLFIVISLNRGLPILFTALGRTDLIVPGRPTFGLTSVEMGQTAETALTLLVLALVPLLGYLAWRFVEEPARRWSRERHGRPAN